MNIVNGSKSFYRFMKRDGVVLKNLCIMQMIFGIIILKTEKLKNVFSENNNGNAFKIFNGRFI